MTVVPCVLSLNVTWSSSVEASIIRILDYRIKVFDAISLKRVRQKNWITSSSLSIGNLKRNRTYIVIIQARNEVGYGKSANISATTLPEGTTKHSHLFYLKIIAAWFWFFKHLELVVFASLCKWSIIFWSDFVVTFLGWKFRFSSSNGQKRWKITS